MRTVTPYSVLVVSIALCFFGYYALRFVVGMTAFGAGVIATVRLLNAGGDLRMSCDMATLAVAIGGGISALVAVLLTKMVSTVLGSLAACTIVGSVFVVCGDFCNADMSDAPRVLGLTLVPFWTAMAVAAGTGARGS